MYWNANYPLGMQNINPWDITDIDECGLFLETANRKYGKVVRGQRSHVKGKYTQGVKLNFLLAICGDDDPENRFH